MRSYPTQAQKSPALVIYSAYGVAMGLSVFAISFAYTRTRRRKMAARLVLEEKKL